MCIECENENIPDPALTLEEAGARVELGAELLSRYERDGEGWANRVDLEILDIASMFDCVGGQLYNGDWCEFRAAYPELTYVDLVNRGFDSPTCDSVELNLLSRAWCEKISAMRAEMA